MLRRFVYAPDPADGRFSPEAHRALATFAANAGGRAAGLEEGLLTPALAAALFRRYEER